MGASRKNPQGSFHYSQINVSKTYIFSNAAIKMNGKQRYTVNGVSFIQPDTPLKLADYFALRGVFTVGSIPDTTIQWRTPSYAAAVLAGKFQDFIEVVFENQENSLQSWHIDGYSFFIVGYECYSNPLFLYFRIYHNNMLLHWKI